MVSFLLFLIPIFFTLQSCSQEHNIFEEEWYLETKDKDIRLYVKEFGYGDTLVVVHGGFGAEYSYLLDPLENLAKKYHLLFYDQRGSLRSPCPDSLITVYKHVEDIEVVLFAPRTPLAQPISPMAKNQKRERRCLDKALYGASFGDTFPLPIIRSLCF